MSQQTTSLQVLYGDFKRFSQNQEYERAFKIANRIFHESPKDLTAFKCKIICMIKLDRFEDALKALQKNKEFVSDLKFEKAYCEYRLNRTQEALATLRSVENHDNRTSELLAQVLYRLENYEECYQLYRNIIQSSEDEYDEERETNLSAVLASRQLWDNANMDDPGLEEKSFELCYNMACYHIGREDFSVAEKKLRKAEEYCRRMFEDDPDVTEEEVEDELAIIRVQLAYVLQKMGKKDEALPLYNQVLKKKPSDVGLGAVAANNIVTINKDQNVFDSKKKMKSATADNLKHKLTNKQHTSININQCLLHLHTNQGEQCHHLASELKRKFPDIDTPVLINAAQCVKEKNIKKAVDVLKKFADAHPESSFSAKLAMAQLHLVQGAVYQACDALKSLGDVQYKLGMVSALVTLYMSQEDHEAASDVMMKSIDWYTKNKSGTDELITLIRANANFQMKSGSPQVAVKMLNELRRLNPDDPQTLAQLISAYSQFDPEKAQIVSHDLPPVDNIAKNVDVDTLEAAFSTLGPKYMKKAQKTDTQPSPGPSGDMIIQKSKRKRKKKGKLPKNPDAELDPERWLPRRERSYFRGKRKDKKKDIGKGTQGATSSAADIDASRTTSASGNEGSSPRPGTASTTSPQGVPQGPRQQKPAQAQKKKKKKGGSKW